MTTFEDGPAKGQRLMLKCAPKFLRVVDAGGKWDALDQPEDTPAPNEALYAYRLVGEPGRCHVSFSGGRGGFYTMATYRLVKEQPTRKEMWQSEAWRQWCQQQAGALS